MNQPNNLPKSCDENTRVWGPGIWSYIPNQAMKENKDNNSDAFEKWIKYIHEKCESKE